MATNKRLRDAATRAQRECARDFLEHVHSDAGLDALLNLGEVLREVRLEVDLDAEHAKTCPNGPTCPYYDGAKP